MKAKILKLIVTVGLFAVLIFWVFNSIEREFVDAAKERILEISNLISSSIPEDDIQSWLEEIDANYPDIQAIYIKGLEEYGEIPEYFYQNPESADLFAKLKTMDFFDYGIESTVYEEIYFHENILKLGNNQYFVTFVPVLEPEYGMVTGSLVLLHNASKILGTIRTIWGFALLLIGVVFAVSFITSFMRDPTLGFTILIVFIIVGTFIAYPLYEAFKLTIFQNGEFSLDVWKKVLTTRNYSRALWGSIKLGMLTATTSTLVGFLFAFSLTRMKLKGKKFFATMATLPVISPPFSLTLSIILLFGNNGLITRRLLGLTSFDIYGLDGLVIVQTMGMFPIAFLVLSGVLEAIDSTLEEAAMNMRANRWKVFTTVTLPLSIPGIASSWLLVFSNSMADFANPLILSGKYKVLSVEAYLEVTGMHRLQNGAALSILLLIPTLTAFLIQRYWVNRKTYVTVTGKPSARIIEIVNRPVKIFLTTMMGLISAFLIGLYSTIVAGCFVKNWGIDYSFTLENITEALSRARDALIDTTTLAAIATPIAGILAMIVAMIIVRKKFPGKKLLQMFVLMPFAIPGTLVGISYIIAFNRPPLLLVGTGAIIVINYVIRELPVGVESGVATLKQIDPAIEEAAQSLGADSPTVFRTIVLPLIRPAFISSLSYTFVRSMTAVSAVIFLISAKWYHITILIYNFSENLRFGLASVLATTLIIIILAVFGLMRLLVKKSSYMEKTIISG
ncbi:MULTISPECIES: iron ABC transporter permease [Kosmotoga]|uniref:Binding-protein-dependent transport systems inner membrane component n=1 Tax=Kosmotoga olearia (strain ATCC BAA-1733 / DSM 21960 / TBF 19.5.1) TaxID=521045 RepID=C5CH61_KOSOT|nr:MULTISPECIES: iron ABC transporter permease [Kosmotoga]ACR80664.1 binding-protein-dependent transport systems inner membrane component [Kosmotoga olearia TBF 19.5.1]MDI3495369.1 iron(III) transport system permease protein [Pseudothermotoga sp.]OAA19113.1 ABC transporter permease [Kosmotoga sp. DU53]